MVPPTNACGVSCAAAVAVNDAPTLTATADDPTFTEGGAAAGLYSSTSIDLVEAFLEIFLLLAPGDLLVMGTPAGVGHARTPQVWMKAGDVCEVEIEKLGILRNPIEDEPSV